jgi:hypothetical protein
MGYAGPIGHVDFYLNGTASLILNELIPYLHFNLIDLGGGPIQPKYKDNHDPGWIGLDRKS